MTHIDAPRFLCRLPSPAGAASQSWFTATHVALLALGVSIAALVVTVVVSVRTFHYLRRSTTAYEDTARATETSAKAAEGSATSSQASAKAAENSAASARVSAKAAEDSAEAARDLLEIERDREYDRMRPKLSGRLVPSTGGPDRINAWLEVHLDASTPQPLRSMLLRLPSGNAFGRGPGAVGNLNDLGFPGEGGQVPPLRPGRPAQWRVYRADGVHGTLRATAKCTREDGMVWEDVEVLITQDYEDTGPAPG